jgi:hypothetical protein
MAGLGIPGLAAAGTLFQIGNLTSPESWQSVANVSDITGPSLAATVVDVTSHTSPTIPWRQKLVTLLDLGQTTIKLFWYPTDPTQNNTPSSFVGGLRYIFINRVKIPVRFLHVDGTYDSYWVFITKLTSNAPIAGVYSMDCTLEGTDNPLNIA